MQHQWRALTLTFLLLCPACSSSEPSSTFSSSDNSSFTGTQTRVKATFCNYDESTLYFCSVISGESAVYEGETPTKPSTDSHHYVFQGWDKPLGPLYEDTTFHAQYLEEINQYTVTFLNEDGSLLYETKVAYGETAIYAGETPSKEGDAQYSYEWVGWDISLENVVSNRVIHAVYAESVNQYHIRFLNDDGSVLQEETLPYGTLPSFQGETPEKARTDEFTYAFDTWVPEIADVVSDCDYVASYSSSRNSYTIELDAGEGTLENDELTVFYGETYTLPVPELEGYDFLGWYLSDTSFPSEGTFEYGQDKALTAHYDAKKNNLMVSSSDVSLGSATIILGEGYSDESITVKAEAIGENIFMGWYSDEEYISLETEYTFTMPRHDFSLEAKFLSKLDYDTSRGILPEIKEEDGCVYYGLYPQSHVSDEKTVAALDELTPDENGYYTYRGELYKKKTADPHKGGIYYSDGTISVRGEESYFKFDRIKWDILQKDWSGYLLLSHYVIDEVTYYQNRGEATRTIDGKTVYPNNYRYSDIREFLNNDFLVTAFPWGGSDRIVTTEVDNSLSSTKMKIDKYVCENTQDKVFLPSRKDLTNSSYGFATGLEDEDMARQGYPSDYCIASHSISSVDGYLTTIYWTRSPRDEPYGAWSVRFNGVLNYDSTVTGARGIRPMIKISL